MVQPLTPATVVPAVAPGSWYAPHPTVDPPRDPPPWWSVAATDPADARRIRYELGAMILLMAVPGLLIGLEGIGEPSSISTDIGVLELLASLASSAGSAAIATQLLWRDGKLRAAGFNRRSPRFVVGYGSLGLVCCYGALLAAGFVALAVFLALGGSVDESTGGDSADIDLSAASLAVAYLISISAGITEEIVFRGYAITRLEQLGWKRAAFIVPGLVFTFLHLYQGIFAIAGIGAVTMVFTWMFKWKRSLLPLMAAHAAFDAIQLTLAAVLAS